MDNENIIKEFMQIDWLINRLTTLNKLLKYVAIC